MMLAALILAGLAAAAVVPIVMELGEGEDDLAPDTDAELSDTSLIETSSADGAVHEIDAPGSETTLARFDEDVDRCVLHTSELDTDFLAVSDGSGGSSLSFCADGETTTVHFPEHPDPPTDAIDVIVSPSDGSDPVTLSLTEFLDAAETPPDDAEPAETTTTPLSPVDPDEPDSPGDGSGDIDVIQPVDPDTPDPGDGEPWDGEVLEPVEDPDPENPATSSTTADGWLHSGTPEGSPNPVEIYDFDVNREMLSVSLVPEVATGPLDVTVDVMDNGEDAMVSVDGIPVAHVVGAAELQTDQIVVAVKSDLTT